MRIIITLLLMCISLQGITKIIGKDDRVKVTQHGKETWGIGVLYSEFDNNKLYKCSGTLISDYYVLTSSHCIFRKELGGYPKKVTFLPGLLKTKTGTNDRYFAEYVWVNKDYVKSANKDPDYIYPNVDIAFVKLIKNDKGQIPGKRYGYKGYRAPSNLNKGASIVAYKNQGKDLHTLFKADNCTAFLSIDNNSYLHTKCDTSSGSSGTALLNKDKRIIGILTGHYGGNQNVFTPLYDNYLDSIDAIKLGKNPTNDFKKYQLDPTMYFAVHFKNSCHEKIYIAYTYKSLEGEWITDGFKVLEPKEALHNVFVTQNTVLAFYAQTYNGDLKWSGDDYRLKVQGKELPFYRKDLPQKFTDQTFGWSCDA